MDDWVPEHQRQLPASVVAVEFLMTERPLWPRTEETSESFRTALEALHLDVPCYDRDQLAGPANLAGNVGWVVITANGQVRWAGPTRASPRCTLQPPQAGARLGIGAACRRCPPGQISLFLERNGMGVLELNRLLTGSPSWRISHGDILFQKGRMRRPSHAWPRLELTSMLAPGPTPQRGHAHPAIVTGPRRSADGRRSCTGSA